MKYGWEIADEVQLYMGDTADIQWVPISEVEKLKVEIERLKTGLLWYAQWDWSDKYIEAVPKKAKEILGIY